MSEMDKGNTVEPHTPTPWMTHRAGEMLPDDWMIMADLGELTNGIQQVSTVARALSIRHTPETTAANAAFIVRAVNNHQALMEALEAYEAAALCVFGTADHIRLLRTADDLRRAALSAAKGET